MTESLPDELDKLATNFVLSSKEELAAKLSEAATRIRQLELGLAAVKSGIQEAVVTAPPKVAPSNT